MAKKRKTATAFLIIDVSLRPFAARLKKPVAAYGSRFFGINLPKHRCGKSNGPCLPPANSRPLARVVHRTVRKGLPPSR